MKFFTGDTVAKSNPEFTLGEHTQDVVCEAQRILSEFINQARKYKKITGRKLKNDLIRACKKHDLGKAHPRWQKYAKEGDLKNVRLRHEFQSIKYARDEGETFRDSVKTAILSHHNKLTQRAEDRWRENIDWKGNRFNFSNLWREMITIQRNSSGLSFEGFIKKKFEFDTIRGLLQLSDRRASKLERSDAPNPLPLRRFRRFEFPYKKKRKVQKRLVEKEVLNKRVVCVRGETGSGKTLGSLLWGQEKNVDRIIFTNPTRFTGSSLYDDLKEEISRNVGLYHSNAGQQIYREDRGREKLKMARKFLFPITVTTIDQVLSCIVGRREDDHLRFSNLSSSCLVIDEVDFYDEVMQANLEVLMEVCEVLDIPVLVMSATLPKAHTSVYSTGKTKPKLVDETKRGSSFKIEKISEVRENFIDKDFEKLLKKSGLDKSERGIIYANTVNRAQKYYQTLRREREDVVLHHSRFTSKDREENEREIRNRLGKEGKGGVAVMTQIGEMGLNIDTDSMITELCPADRLSQRTGRMKRFRNDEESPGSLTVAIPKENGRLYPAPYGNFNPNNLEWIPAGEMIETYEWLKKSRKETINKKDLVEATDSIYDSVPNFEGAPEDNQSKYYEEMRGNWIIVPNLEELGNEDESIWRTRIIPPSTFVVVRPEKLKTKYEDMDTWLNHKDEISVSIPRYVIEDSLRVKTKKIQVGEDFEEYVSVLRYPEEDYSEEFGLTINTDIEANGETFSWVDLLTRNIF